MPSKKDVEKVMEILFKEFRKHRKPTVRNTEKTTPFRTLISCLISLRCQDATTGKVSGELFKVADTPEKIAKLPIKKLENILYSSGYYKNKSKVIKNVSKIILNKYNGKVPKNFDKLMELKGVGRKTANITMLYGHGIPDYIPVDSHVHVIANRLGWVKTKNPDQTEFELKKVLPRKYWYDINTLLILFGQNICITISPWCSKCPIKKYCPRIGVSRSR